MNGTWARGRRSSVFTLFCLVLFVWNVCWSWGGIILSGVLSFPSRQTRVNQLQKSTKDAFVGRLSSTFPGSHPACALCRFLFVRTSERRRPPHATIFKKEIKTLRPQVSKLQWNGEITSLKITEAGLTATWFRFGVYFFLIQLSSCVSCESSWCMLDLRSECYELGAKMSVVFFFFSHLPPFKFKDHLEAGSEEVYS